MLKVEKVTTYEGFQALDPVWNTLLEQSASNAITLTFEWLSTWWEVFNKDRELYIVVARDGDEVIGIAPLLKRTVLRNGLLPFRRLEFLASGEEEADEICSDYLDFILQGGREGDALTAILQFIREDGDWDEMLLTDVLGESASLDVVKSFCDVRGITVQTVREQIALYLPLDNGFSEVLTQVGSSFRRRIKQDRKTFATYGGQIRIVKHLEDFETAFATLIDLHQVRWTARGKPGVFASEKFTLFHRLLAQKVMGKGWVRFYFALRGGKPFAAIYNFTYNGKAYYYQSGLRLEDSGLISPGVLLQSYAIEDSIKIGLREYDFLKSESGSYKFKWTHRTRSLVQTRLAMPRAKEALYKTTSIFMDGLRSIKKNITNTATS